MLTYPEEVDTAQALTVTQAQAPSAGRASVGIIGAGMFANSILLPALAKTDAHLAYIADLNAAAAGHAAKKFGVAQAVTDYQAILADDAVSAIFVLVGHHLHARFVCEALEAGKHVFVEKPLAMNEEELAQVVEAAAAHPDRLVMVGFNRRFSPHTRRIQQALAGRNEAADANHDG